ncbi:extracellular ligand-binding receptor [Caballeronia glebae]|uniref:Extracellular ligand-binding receptor n=2 Tax=Caballeronia glebae TaxID=1777143 RepID=A0A157ZJ23_9BURK|nr:extracellular ligand-binding receptor [Caballeronia glebae]
MVKGKTWRGMSTVIATGTAMAGLSFAVAAHAAGEPIKIGVISEESAVAGASISKAAQLAAEEINAKGGVDGRQIQIVAYDDHSSASDGVRAFQRAASQDKVVAIIGSYISEVALAMEPWSARLKMPFITPGAASNEISKRVHDDYNNYKYTFHGWMTSAFIAQSICDFSHDVLVGEFKMKTTVVMSEDAAWTKPLDERYLECLPKAGLQVLDHIRFNPDTSDFTPIFNQIEAKHPDTITTGISHVGVQPTVQWHDQQVPIPMSGQSSQATTTSFWKDTNGATEGVITASAAAPGVAVTPKTVPFVESYQKHFAGVSPAYDGFTSYDLVYIIADAIHRNQGSTDPDKMVDALEKTDYVGTIGRWQFYGKNDQFTHALKYGEGYITGINLQWQNGKQVAIWPKSVANAKVKFPAFVKVQAAAN